MEKKPTKKATAKKKKNTQPKGVPRETVYVYPWTRLKDLKPKQKIMLNALEKCLGVVTDASNLCGVSRYAHYEWMKNNPTYKKFVDDMEDISLDFAESKLHSLIKGITVTETRRRLDPDAKEGEEKKIIEETTVYQTVPCKTATIFYLKTKGKKRGYIERQELTGAEGSQLVPAMQPIVLNVVGNTGGDDESGS